MEVTLTREFVHTLPRCILLVTCLFTFTFTDVPTSDSKSKPSPTANTRLPSAMLINFALNSASLPFQTFRRRWKTANESQSSSLYSRLLHVTDRYIAPLRFMHQQLANNNPTVAKVSANKRPHSAINGPAATGPTNATEGATTTTGEPETAPPPQPGKRPRGRPKGSKTKKKNIDAPPKEVESIMR